MLLIQSTNPCGSSIHSGYAMQSRWLQWQQIRSWLWAQLCLILKVWSTLDVTYTLLVASTFAPALACKSCKIGRHHLLLINVGPYFPLYSKFYYPHMSIISCKYNETCHYTVPSSTGVCASLSHIDAADSGRQRAQLDLVNVQPSYKIYISIHAPEKSASYQCLKTRRPACY